jgi:hypothetical protein
LATEKKRKTLKRPLAFLQKDGMVAAINKGPFLIGGPVSLLEGRSISQSGNLKLEAMRINLLKGGSCNGEWNSKMVQ